MTKPENFEDDRDSFLVFIFGAESLVMGDLETVEMRGFVHMRHGLPAIIVLSGWRNM